MVKQVSIWVLLIFVLAACGDADVVTEEQSKDNSASISRPQDDKYLLPGNPEDFSIEVDKGTE